MAWILLAVGVVLIALTAIYVAAEFSLVTVDRAAVDRGAGAGGAASGRAKAVRAALGRLSTQLSGAQVGITVTTLALGYVMEPSLAVLLRPLLGGLGLSDVAAASVAVTVSLLLATALSMVFGELVPKNIAIAQPLRTAGLVVRPLRATTVVSRPLIWALNGTANGVLRLLGIAPQEELRSTRSAQELFSLVRRSGALGTLEQRTARLLAQSIAFSGKTADDVLTPRVDVEFVRADDGAPAVIEAALASGHSRFPVIGADADDVVGLVHLKRVVAVPPDQRAAVTVRALMVPAPVVPGTLPLDDALVQLRGPGLQMAVVADEYGGTAGIVTLEDVVEELVGEIADEHDPSERRPAPRPDGTWLLSGSLRPDEVADLTGVSLPESGAYETVAGLVMDRLGRLPQVGDEVLVTAVIGADAALGALPGDVPMASDTESDLPRPVTARLTARRMDGRRLAELHLSSAHPGVLDPDEPQQDGAGGSGGGSSGPGGGAA
jgi:CBS domain containing-hemolysin-like protein